MRLDNEIKLDYKDVLLKPKRSTLSSRRDVDMTRSFTFRHTGETYECCPIIASNMDGVGTFSMAKVIQEYKMMTTITKTRPLLPRTAIQQNSPTTVFSCTVSLLSNFF